MSRRPQGSPTPTLSPSSRILPSDGPGSPKVGSQQSLAGLGSSTLSPQHTSQLSSLQGLCCSHLHDVLEKKNGKRHSSLAPKQHTSYPGFTKLLMKISPELFHVIAPSLQGSGPGPWNNGGQPQCHIWLPISASRDRCPELSPSGPIPST